MTEVSMAVVRTFIDLVLSGDRAGALALLHPEVVVVESESLSFGGTYRGHGGFLELGRRISEAITDRSGSTGDPGLLAAGDTVIANGQVAGRSTRTGQIVSSEVLERYRIVDGLISEITPFYFDPSGF